MKIIKFVKWDRYRIEDMLKKVKIARFTFHGIQLWCGIYIGFIDGRIVEK